MDLRHLDVRNIRIRPANLDDAAAIRDAHLDSDLYINAMNGGEAFFVATATLDGKDDVLGFSTHRIDDAQDGTSVYVRGRAARRGIGTLLLRQAEDHARTGRRACRFRRPWPVWSSTGQTGSKKWAGETRRCSLVRRCRASSCEKR